MLEWYRAGETYESLMQDCAALLALAAERAGAKTLRLPRPRGRSLRRAGAADRRRRLCAPCRHRPAGHGRRRTARPTATRCTRAVGQAGLRTAPDDSWSDLFSRVMVERIEPDLGTGARDDPLRISDLGGGPCPAERRAIRRVAERFELYCCGVELANAFGELTDADEQRRRFAADMDEKEKIYGERYPIDEDFLAALAIMPEASGVALGFDRLVMLATGARSDRGRDLDAGGWLTASAAPAADLLACGVRKLSAAAGVGRAERQRSRRRSGPGWWAGDRPVSGTPVAGPPGVAHRKLDHRRPGRREAGEAHPARSNLSAATALLAAFTRFSSMSKKTSMLNPSTNAKANRPSPMLLKASSLPGPMPSHAMIIPASAPSAIW